MYTIVYCAICVHSLINDQRFQHELSTNLHAVGAAELIALVKQELVMLSKQGGGVNCAEPYSNRKQQTTESYTA